MEHKLIQGGEKWLPFARARIRTLRAVGLQHAAQSFTLPDALVRVRIVEEDEFIYISGGDSLIPMDSGVVEARSIAPASPLAYTAGTLHESAAVADYNAPFVLPKPEATLRVNPATGNDGEASGTIRTVGNLDGRVPIDGAPAKSFSPLRDEPDSTLLNKKTTAVLVPASIFTGRCRMWIQALYGSHLYQGAVPRYVPEVVSETTAAPALRFEDVKDPEQTILVTTSSGVYMDPETAEHWLICPQSGSTVYIYPMLPSLAAKRLRRFLIPPYSLSDTDREHIETYILSQSRPTNTGRQTVDTGFSVQAYSLGYGWHWAWSTAKADIVVNDQFAQDEPNLKYAMVSNHYRLTMTLTNGVWSGTVGAIAGPSEWCANRPTWVLTEPNFASFEQTKVTPQLTNVFACNATFYAYYVRDELVTCSISVSFRPAATIDVREGWGAARGVAIFGNQTRGLLPGYDEQGTQSSRWEATVTVGDQVFGPVPYGGTVSGSTLEITNKVLTGTFIAGFGAAMFPQLVDEGYPPYNRLFEPVGVSDASQFGRVLYDHISDTYTGTAGGHIFMGAPFYDAEAFFVDAVAKDTKATNRTVQPWRNDDAAGGQWVRANECVTLGQVIYYGDEEWGFPAGLNHVHNGASVASTPTVETIRFSGQYMMARDQLLDFQIEATGPWMDNGSDVATPVYMLSGSQVGDKTLAHSPTNDTEFGMPAAEFGAPVFVGWV